MDPVAYVASLSPKQLAALAIARRMLGPAFSLEKSIGYLKVKS